ncbi:MAG: hypothetical protein LC720_01055 [Actinobacteria bacterium]|nr:hypothetical protein [Actinomycetota bacterium]
MTAAERRALLFFAGCVALSLGLEALDLSGAVHSVALRLVAVFSFVVGLIVLLLRGHEKTRADAASGSKRK